MCVCVCVCVKCADVGIGSWFDSHGQGSYINVCVCVCVCLFVCFRTAEPRDENMHSKGCSDGRTEFEFKPRIQNVPRETKTSWEIYSGEHCKQPHRHICKIWQSFPLAVLQCFAQVISSEPSKSKKNACIGQKGILAIHTHRKNRNVQRTDSQAIITICMVSQAITICLWMQK